MGAKLSNIFTWQFWLYAKECLIAAKFQSNVSNFSRFARISFNTSKLSPKPKTTYIKIGMNVFIYFWSRVSTEKLLNHRLFSCYFLMAHFLKKLKSNKKTFRALKFLFWKYFGSAKVCWKVSETPCIFDFFTQTDKTIKASRLTWWAMKCN